MPGAFSVLLDVQDDVVETPGGLEPALLFLSVKVFQVLLHLRHDRAPFFSRDLVYIAFGFEPIDQDIDIRFECHERAF